jgi:RNA polymerase sigma-70 factor (ECF subfamily)
MDTTSPTLLARLAAPGESEAWDRFTRLYTPLLLGWAARLGFQPADAADLSQDVLLKLVRLLPEYRRGEGQSFRGWLFRVATNQARDFHRRRATRPMPAAEGLSGVADASVEMTEAEYRQALVRRGLELIRGDFTEATWAAFTGVMVDGRTAAEVATALGVSVNVVYLARHRVLTRLRQELDGLLDDEPG